MLETAKTKRLKTMLFVWITTGVNQILKRLIVYESKRKINIKKIER